VEGLTCHDVPAFSVQFHPEAAAGPHDAAYLFDRFIDLMADRRAGAVNDKAALDDGEAAPSGGHTSHNGEN
jgi:carbamoyl-phosphate synthase small subunit